MLGRSFSLSLHLLPDPIDFHFARAYLLARAADTVVDTDAVAPRERDRILADLEEAAGCLAQGDPIELAPAPLGPGGTRHERALMTGLPAVAEWVNELEIPARRRAGEVCRTLFGAMRKDLARFGRHSGRVTALRDEGELEVYLYENAGCVGEYWAQELATTSFRFTGVDLQSLADAGIHIGKALQRVNVLRDLATDVRRGRCYLPERGLAACGLEPRDLYFPDVAPRLKPLLDAQIAAVRADLEAGLDFFHHLPYRWLRRRAAATLPAVLARRTLDRIEADPVRLLNPEETIKVPRGEVYRLLARLLLLPPGDRSLRRLVLGRERRFHRAPSVPAGEV